MVFILCSCFLSLNIYFCSLFFLEVIDSDSKLTRILQESLGGNARTTLIITCSPSSYNEAESISTMRFGERAKKIKNKPTQNKEYSIEQLKKMLNKAEKKVRLVALLDVHFRGFIQMPYWKVVNLEYFIMRYRRIALLSNCVCLPSYWCL